MEITIEYCTMWGYLDKALSLRESIQRKFGVKGKLIKGQGGVFEITLNNSLIFSKKELGRFPDDNEISDIIDEYEYVT